MIRFNCPNCNRLYELPPALAFLPLVCKQCGQRITPPADSPSPVAKPQAAKPVAPALTTVDDEDDGVLVTRADTSPDIDFNVGGPTAASLSDAARPRPAELADPPAVDELQKINLDLLGPAAPPAPKRAPKPPEPEAPPDPRPEPTLLPFVADLIVFVALVVVGMVVGEMLVGKPTGQVLSESGSSTKFPPPDLLLWGGPPVTFALIYLLLGARKATVGEWLRRRKK